MEHNRPFHPQGAEIAAQAFDDFEAWCRVNDPDGEKSLNELVEVYSCAKRHTPGE